jgi:hypothetical protein
VLIVFILQGAEDESQMRAPTTAHGTSVVDLALGEGYQGTDPTVMGKIILAS